MPKIWEWDSSPVYVVERDPLDSFEGMQPWAEYAKAVPDHDRTFGDALDRVTKAGEIREEFAGGIPAPARESEPRLFMRIRKMEDGGTTYVACCLKDVAWDCASRGFPIEVTEKHVI